MRGAGRVSSDGAAGDARGRHTLRGKTISPAASFVLGIQFANSYFCDSRCPFGELDNQKQMLGRFRSHFHKCGEL